MDLLTRVVAALVVAMDAAVAGTAAVAEAVITMTNVGWPPPAGTPEVKTATTWMIMQRRNPPVINRDAAVETAVAAWVPAWGAACVANDLIIY